MNHVVNFKVFTTPFLVSCHGNSGKKWNFTLLLDLLMHRNNLHNEVRLQINFTNKLRDEVSSCPGFEKNITFSQGHSLSILIIC